MDKKKWNIKKIILFIILFFTFQNAFADLEIKDFWTYIRPDYYSYNTNSGAFEILAISWYPKARIYDIEWNLTAYATSEYWYNYYNNSLYIELLNGDLIIAWLYSWSSSNSNYERNGRLYYYNRTQGAVHIIQGYWLTWYGCNTGFKFAIVENKLIFTYLNKNDRGSGSCWNTWSSYYSILYELDLNIPPTADNAYYTNTYTGAILNWDMPLFYNTSTNLKQTGENEFVAMWEDDIFFLTCTEEYSGLCAFDYWTSGQIKNYKAFSNEDTFHAWYTYFSWSTETIATNFDVFGSGYLDVDNMFLQSYNFNTFEFEAITQTEIDALEFTPDNKLMPMIIKKENNWLTDYFYTVWRKQYVFTSSNPFESGIYDPGGTGEDPGTWTGSGIDYDESIWDFDTDGDEDVWFWEFFIWIGRVIGYGVNSIIDFFGELKKLIDMLWDSFTDEVKTFSFIQTASAEEPAYIWIMFNTSVDMEAYEETTLWKFNIFVRGFIVFFIFAISLALFIWITRKKGG